MGMPRQYTDKLVIFVEYTLSMPTERASLETETDFLTGPWNVGSGI